MSDIFTFDGSAGKSAEGFATQHAAATCNSCAAGISGGFADRVTKTPITERAAELEPGLGY